MHVTMSSSPAALPSFTKLGVKTSRKFRIKVKCSARKPRTLTGNVLCKPPGSAPRSLGLPARHTTISELQLFLPQVLWGLKALTFSKGTQGIDGCIFTLLCARMSPDTPTPSKSNLSDQTKTSFCHWENWTSARQNPQHSLWSLDDHQNKHLENSALVTQ